MSSPTYYQNPINILDSTGATGLGSGGSMTIGGGISVGENVFVGGNLSVYGTTTSFSDNIIVLNQGATQSLDTGFLLARNAIDITGQNNYSALIYSEVNDEFCFGYATEDTHGTINLNDYISIRSGGLTITNGSLNAGFNTHTIGNIFTTGGNVGIATTIPGYRLDVNGSLNFSGNLYQDGLLYRSSQWVSGTGGALFYTNGNVGINTTAPSYTLDVVGSGDFTTFITTANLYSTNQTTTNIVGTNISGTILNISSSLTTGTLLATTSISTGAISSPVGTITNIIHAGVTTATLLATTSISTGGIFTTTITSTNAYVSNNMFIGGTLTALSDKRLKTNIESANLDICYDAIKNIPLKRYTWRDDIYKKEEVFDRSKLGWIAQDVEQVFPKAVQRKNMFGYTDCRTLNSDQIMASLYGSVQKLMKIVEALQDEVNQLKKSNF